METRKLTEAGMISALFVVLSLVMLMTGGGYWLFLDIMAPMMVVMSYLRCGGKVSAIMSFNSLCILFLLQGNVVTLLYLVQAVGVGLICGWLLEKEWELMEDMILASLLGCILMLGLDRATAILTGVSLLQDIPVALTKGLSTEAVEIVYYMSIASVPLASTLMVYIGSLFVGRRLGLLNAKQQLKYKQLRYYPRLAPFIYCSSKTMILGGIMVLVINFITPILAKGYLKAFLVCSAMILLYFILQDVLKLMTLYFYEKVGNKGLVMLIKWCMLMMLLVSFKLSCIVLTLADIVIDFRTPLKKKNRNALDRYICQFL